MNVLLFSMPDVIPMFPPHAWRPPNLGIASLAANTTDHDVTCADLVCRRDDVPAAVREAMDTVKPALVGLSAMSFQFATALGVAERVKKIAPSVPIVLGGYHATLMANEITDDARSSKLIDFLIRGEGETSFNALVHAVAGEGRLEDVPGLSWKKDGQWVHNPRGPLEDLSRVKIPKRSARLWNGEYFLHGMQSGKASKPLLSTIRRQPLDVIETSRGCTMACNFCSMRHMYGPTFRPYPIERVMVDIADSASRGTSWIILSDDNITLDVARLEALCDAIIDSGIHNVGFIVQASSTGLASSERLVRKMSQANFRFVFLGIENADEANLRRIRKGDILEKTRTAIRYLHKYKILIVGGVIVGLPEDDEAQIVTNYKFLHDEQVDFFADQIATPYPKTGLREEMLQAGLVTNPDDFSRYDGFWANVRTKHLTSDEVQFLRWKYRRLYSKLTGTTPALRASFSAYAVLRSLLYKPFRNLARRLLNWNKTEIDLFRAEMKRCEKLNKFFEE